MSTITTLVTPTVTLSPVTVSIESGKKLTKAERTLATAFAHWANVADQADDATLLLAIHLIHADVSARRASEIAVEALGSDRGWSRNKVTAVRATAPVWEFAVSPDRQADDVIVDDEGERVSIDALISQVRGIVARIGAPRAKQAIEAVDVPSFFNYIQALTDEDDRGKGDPAPAVADETEQADDVEAEDEPTGTTDADRVQAILNILSGIEGDDTLAGALPALLDAVTAVASKALPVEATV